MLTRAFWLGTLDRAVKTFAQALLLLGVLNPGLNVLDVDWRSALGISLGAAGLSVLTSLISAPVGDPGTTSMLPGGR